MRCKVCHIKIQNKLYTGLGESEKLCDLHAGERIKAKAPMIRKLYEKEVGCKLCRLIVNKE